MTEDIVDTPLPAEPRTKARSWDDPILYEAAVMRPQCTFITHWHSCRLDAGHPGRHSPGQLPAASDPRPDLREALERIREHAERLHLDLVYVGPGAILDDPWSLLSAAEPSVPARCAECSEIEVNRVHNEPTLSAYHPFAALATTPPAVEDRYWNGHLADCRRRGGTNRSAKQHACSCGFLSHLLTASEG